MVKMSLPPPHGLVALVALGAVALASLLGGVAGMRYHREVDQAAFEPATS